MSTEEVPVEKPTVQKHEVKKPAKPRVPYKSGVLFPSELEVKEMERYTRELMKQLRLKTGTRSWPV